MNSLKNNNELVFCSCRVSTGQLAVWKEEIQLKTALTFLMLLIAILFLAVKIKIHFIKHIQLYSKTLPKSKFLPIQQQPSFKRRVSLSCAGAMQYFSCSWDLAPALREGGGTGRKHSGAAKLTAIGSYILVKYCTQPFPFSTQRRSQKFPS